MYGRDQLRVAVVGATGAVGKTLLTLFEERRFEYASLDLVASSRSAGSIVRIGSEEYRVSSIESFDFSNVDLVFCSAGSAVSREWVPRIRARGPLVIDNTNAFRMDPDTPLVVPQVNPEALRERPVSGIIANPNCTTIPLTRVLKPIDDLFGVERVVISTYQAGSGGGLRGLEEFRSGSRKVLEGHTGPLAATRFPVPLAFNLIPSIDLELETGFTLEEQKMVQESRKILGRPDLAISATAVRVPVMNCHSEAVLVDCDKDLRREDLIELISSAPEVEVHSAPGPGGYPTPRCVSGSNDVHVGRVRIDPDNSRTALLWIVSDNLRIGAALNAIQIAETITESHAA